MLVVRIMRVSRLRIQGSVYLTYLDLSFAGPTRPRPPTTFTGVAVFRTGEGFKPETGGGGGGGAFFGVFIA